jgi:hypothetical protein
MRVSQVLTRADYLSRHPQDGPLIRHSCADEVLVGEEGTAIRFRRAVPPAVLERFSFRSRKAERCLKHVEEGKLNSAIGLQGIFRLTWRSAQDLDEVLNGEFATPDSLPLFDSLE